MSGLTSHETNYSKHHQYKNGVLLTWQFVKARCQNHGEASRNFKVADILQGDSSKVLAEMADSCHSG